MSDANVKIRHSLMDIKVLVEVSPSGLQQWRPVLKATFPLSSDAVKTLWSALGMTVPAPGGDALTLEVLSEVLTKHGVRDVAVHKRRVRYTIDGCMSEMTEVVADGKAVRSVAIESEDAERVIGAVRAMGLAGFSNISYASGLKTLVGMQNGEA